MTQTPTISDALRRDLSLVLPPLPPPPPPLSPTELADQARAIAERLDAARAPAIVGLGGVTLEAARWAVALAERSRAKLLPHPLPPDVTPGGQPVTQTATLGHIYASDLIIWVGCTGTDGPIAAAIAARQLRASFVEATLDAVLPLRAELAGGADLFGGGKRVAVVLAPGCDGRVASQWHKLAAAAQQHARVAVVRLPDLARQGNLRGVLEVVTWQTGLSCATGGIDFADGAPRPCPGFDALSASGHLDFTFKPQGVFAPCAARVMRFDGVILWLCDDPAAAPPDPTAAFIEAVYHNVRRRS